MAVRSDVTRGQGDAGMEDEDPDLQVSRMSDPQRKPRSETTLGDAAAAVRARLRSRFPDVAAEAVEDAVSDAIQRLLESEPGFVEDPVPYLQQLAVWNLYRSLRERRWRSATPPGGIEQVRDPGPAVERETLGREVQDLAGDERLVSRRSRTILHLWSLGYRFREIAIRVHLKSVTVRKKKERAIRKIRKYFRRDED